MQAVELCAGAGGQALGVETAGFEHAALVEIDKDCCDTLKQNRSAWNVVNDDLSNFDGRPFEGVELLAGGLPCPPFSIAGKQLGEKDERNLFPEGIRLIGEIRPKAVMFENVRGILSSSFDEYRTYVTSEIEKLGYRVGWRLFNSADFGVPQSRSRVVMMAVRNSLSTSLPWPAPSLTPPPNVGETLVDLMAANGWTGANDWAAGANKPAPTIVGGSKKHGGPDLGPSRAKAAWAEMGVNGRSIANEPPSADLQEMPRLTVRMVARLQGFPDEWKFAGKKTSSYRQVGNAFPPPVAAAVAKALKDLIQAEERKLATI
ncbi:MAG: DNA cytosine methyltransferase [Verrucomicrobiota bacterium]